LTRVCPRSAATQSITIPYGYFHSICFLPLGSHHQSCFYPKNTFSADANADRSSQPNLSPTGPAFPATLFLTAQPPISSSSKYAAHQSRKTEYRGRFRDAATKRLPPVPASCRDSGTHEVVRTTRATSQVAPTVTGACTRNRQAAPAHRTSFRRRRDGLPPSGAIAVHARISHTDTDAEGCDVHRLTR